MATLDWSECPAVESIPGKVSGAWVFKNTRMPVSTVFENLESGATIDELTEWFHVTRDQIVAVLEFAARSLDSPTARSRPSAQEGVENGRPAPGATGAALLAVLQASPYREIDLTPPRERLPVRDVPAPVAPFREDERIDYNAWQVIVDTLIGAGVDGLCRFTRNPSFV